MEVVVTLENRKLWSDYMEALNNFNYAFHGLPYDIQKKMLGNSINPHDDIDYLYHQLSLANDEWDKLDPLSVVKIGGFYKTLLGKDAFKNNEDTEYIHVVEHKCGNFIVEEIRLTGNWINVRTVKTALWEEQLERFDKNLALRIIDGYYSETTENEWNTALNMHKQLQETYDNSRGHKD